ncbi:MAG: EthD domain-containing protein [Sandaracinus sp.]
MEKHVYVWRPPEPQIRIFARAGRDAIERRLDGAGLRTVVVHTTHVPPPALSLVPFRRSPMALVSMRGDETALAEAGRRLGTLPGRVEGYAVEESVPIACARPPRATLVTLFRRAPRVSTELFLRRWHGEHTPMTLEIHPVVGYVRNVVRAPLAPDAPPWDGIVTEDFAELADLTTLRLFGRGPRALVNVLRIARHVPTFLDLSTIETYLTEAHAPPP